MITKKDPYDFKREVLKNGTEIFYKKERCSNKTYVYPFFKWGGARDDPDKKVGTAHMLEHLMSKKTSNFPTRLLLNNFTLEHDINWNCFTDLENIRFEGDCFKEDVNSLFFLLKEFFKKNEFDEELLTKEKKVVISELGLKQKIKPWADVELETNKALFVKHPFSRIIGPDGTIWSVNSLTLEDIKKHYEKFFCASNLKVVVISNLGFGEIKSKIEKYLNLPERKINYQLENQRYIENFPKPRQKFLSYSVSEIMKTKKYKETANSIELFAVLPTSQAIEGWEIIAQILKKKLLEKIRYEKSLAYSVGVSGSRYSDISVIEIKILNTKADGMQLKDLILKKINKFNEWKKEFDIYKRNELRTIDNYQALPSEIIKQARWETAVFGKPTTMRKQKKEIENFSFEKAVDWINRWLNEDRILARIITP